jgi:hypothetical protein
MTGAALAPFRAEVAMADAEVGPIDDQTNMTDEEIKAQEEQVPEDEDPQVPGLETRADELLDTPSDMPDSDIEDDDDNLGIDPLVDELSPLLNEPDGTRVPADPANGSTTLGSLT